jgi:peptidoglycan hydrolase-like protein with peptidoglycan-binding domain
MIPLVLNDDTTRLIQINMQGSVGQSGRNSPVDVKMVQAMLNNVPTTEGGPSTRLAIDGLVGPITIGAIARFQRAAKLKIVDGRIDLLGPTIRALGRTLNARGLMPRNVPGIGPVDNRIRRGLIGDYGAAPRPVRDGVAASQGFDPLGLTDWKFRSSSGVSMGADVLGIAAMYFYLEKDSRPGMIRKFPWSGVGAGLSAAPIGLEISFERMPSFGRQLRQGLFNGANPMPEDDFQGPCTVYSAGVSAGVGWSGTLCLFGSLGPIIATTRAIGFITGMEVGIPGAGITGFFGMTARAEEA